MNDHSIGETFIVDQDKTIKDTADFISLPNDDDKKEFQIFKETKSTVSDMLTTLIYFLATIVRDDPQNLCLVSTLSAKNFVICFKECEIYFYFRPILFTQL